MPDAVQDWLEAISVADVLAGLVAVGVLVAGLKWLVPIVRGAVGVVVDFARRISAFLESWHGRPPSYDAHGTLVDPGHPGVPGRLLGYDEAIEGMTVGLNAVRDGQDEHAARLADVLGRVAAHDAAIAQISYDTKPNGGHSAHDRLAKRLDANADSLESLREMVAGALQELGELRRDYEQALRANHPGYDPDRYSD